MERYGKYRFLKKYVICISLVIITGLLYALFISISHWSIPCILHTTTGLYCPGCGVTKMCLSLLNGDIVSAYHANAFLLSFSPLFLLLFIRASIRYCKEGKLNFRKWENHAIWICVGASLVFFLHRNFF